MLRVGREGPVVVRDRLRGPIADHPPQAEQGRLVGRRGQQAVVPGRQAVLHPGGLAGLLVHPVPLHGDRPARQPLLQEIATPVQVEQL